MNPTPKQLDLMHHALGLSEVLPQPLYHQSRRRRRARLAGARFRWARCRQQAQRIAANGRRYLLPPHAGRQGVDRLKGREDARVRDVRAPTVHHGEDRQGARLEGVAWRV